MSISLIRQLTYAFISLLFLLGGPNLASQSIRVQARLHQVSFNYPNSDDESGGPDVRWSYAGRVRFNGWTRQLNFGDFRRNNVSGSSGTYTVNHNLFDQTIDLPEFQFTSVLDFDPSVVLDLCEDIKFELDYDGKELDGILNPNDYVENGSGVFTITDQNAGTWHSKTFRTQGRGSYTYTAQFRYDIYDPISNVSFTDNNNNPLGRTVCAETQIKMKATVNPAFSGGNVRFERAPRVLPNLWESLQESSLRSLQLNSSDLQLYNYRISMASTGRCLGSEGSYFYVPDRLLPNLAPGFTMIPISVTETCEGSANGSITYTGINDFDGNPMVKFTLKKTGAVGGGEEKTVRANQRTSFNGLEAGTYKLEARVMGSTPSCFSMRENITVAALKRPILTSVTPTSPGCGQQTGSIRVGANRNGNNEVQYLLKTAAGGSIANSSFTGNTNYTFDNLAPGSYRVELVGGNGCGDSNSGMSNNENTVTIGTTPSPAGGTVIIPNNGSGFDIACNGGTVQVELDPPNGQGPYRVEVPTGTPTFYTINDGRTAFHTITSSGNYTYTFIRTRTGCRTTRTISVTENPSAIGLNLSVRTRPTAGCSTSSNGSIEASITSGVPPFTITNDAGETLTTQNSPNFVIDELTAGVYNLTVTDRWGCSDTKSIPLEAMAALTLTYESTPETCQGSADGMIELQGQGGTSPYTYRIEGVNDTYGTENVFSGIPPGSYLASVRDNTNCERTISVTVAPNRALRVLSKSISRVVCHDDATDVTLTLTGPTLCGSGIVPGDPFEYSLDDGNSFQTVTNTSLGTSECAEDFTITLSLPTSDYDLQIRTRSGCLSSTSIQASDFFEPKPLEIMIDTVTNVSCFEGSDGTIKVNYAGGIGYYRIEVRDYFLEDQYNVAARVERVPPGAGTYTFTNFNLSQNTGEGLGYYIFIRDNNNAEGNIDLEGGFCTAIQALVSETQPPIQQPAPINIDAIDLGPPVECDYANAQFTITEVSGGTPPYQFRLNNGSFQDSNVLFPTSFRSDITVRDSLGCVFQSSYDLTLTDNQPMLAVEVVRAPTSCSPGILALIPSLGTPPYVIDLTGADGGRPSIANDTSFSGETLFFEVPEAGIYFPSLIDSFTCPVAVNFGDGFRVEAGPELEATQVMMVPESCRDSNDGSITIEVAGGLPPYKITYLGVETTGPTRTLENRGEGTYTFIISDSLDCFLEYEGTIGINAVIGLEAGTSGGGPCNDSETATMTVYPFGGQSPYQLEWLDDPAFNVTIRDGEGGATRANLASTEYSIRITDANGCQQVIDQLVKGVPAITSNVVDLVQPNCIENGRFDLDIFGVERFASVFMSYNEGPSVEVTSPSQVQDLPPGIYIYDIVDDNDCRRVSPDTIIILPINTTLTVVPTVEKATCDGGANGILSVDLDLSSPENTFSLNGGPAQNSPIFTGLAAGTYSLEVVTLNCTVTVDDIIVPDNPPLNISECVVEEDLCRGESGYVVLASGGTPPYRYLDSEEGFSEFGFYNLGAGSTMQAVVEDAVGCQVTVTLSGPEAPELEIINSNYTETFCVIGDTLRGSVDVIGGKPPYRFQWSNGSQDSILLTVIPDYYQLTVMDANDCTVGTLLPIGTSHQPLSINQLVITPGNCAPVVTSGSVWFDLIGGSGNYDIILEDLLLNTFSPNSSLLFSNLRPGLYKYTITDMESGCRIVDRLIINNEDGPALEILVLSPPNCFGPGTVQVINTDGEPLEDIFWSNSDGQVDITSFPAGQHFVAASRGDNCFNELSFILEETKPELSISNQQQPGCGISGSLTVSVINGVSNPSFQWSTGATTQTISGLNSGTYTVTYTDDSGCSDMLSVLLAEAEPLRLVIEDQTTVGCQPGFLATATVSASGGRAPYSYNWSTGSTDATAGDLMLGEHSVTVTDANGCTESLTTNVQSTSGLSLTVVVIQQDDCSLTATGVAVALVKNATSPYEYIWSNGSTDESIQDVPAGLYSVTVTDARGCSISNEVTIEGAEGPKIALVEQRLASCGSDTFSIARVSASGGAGSYIYTWSTGEFGATSRKLREGSSFVTVTDSVGCSDVLEVVVTPPARPRISLTSQTTLGCDPSSASAEVEAAGGLAPYFYEWSSGETGPTANNLVLGNNSVTVTDVLGCQDTLSLTIETGEIPSLSLMEITPADCIDGTGSISVTASGGAPPYDYAWSHNSLLNAPVAAMLFSGQYTVTVTDANGCTDVLEVIEVAFQAPPAVRTESVQAATCGEDNGRIVLEVSGGTGMLTYTWEDDVSTGPIAENLAPGGYQVTVTGENNCNSTLDIVIQDIPLPSLTAIVIPANCEESVGSITLTPVNAVPTVSYSWSHDLGLAGAVAANLAAGNYPVTLTDGNGCTIDTSFVVSGSPAVTLDDGITTPTLCGEANGTLQISPSGGTGNYSYEWNYSGSDTASGPNLANLPAGSYPVTVTDEVGCSASQIYTILNVDGQDEPDVVVINASCTDGNGSITIDIPAGNESNTYQWSHDNTLTGNSANDLNRGDYQITMTDVNNCPVIISRSVDLDLPPAMTLTPVEISCGLPASGSISSSTTGGAMPLTYAWSNGEITDAISGLTAGTYRLTITDNNGCITVDSVTLSSRISPEIMVDQLQTVGCAAALGEAVFLIDQLSGPGTFTFSDMSVMLEIEDLGDGQARVTASGLTADNYTLTVENDNGCSTQQNILIETDPALQVRVDDLQEETCAGANNASLLVSVVGDPTGITFQWDTAAGGGTDPALMGLSPGSYTVTATNSRGCFGTLTIDIMAGDQLLLPEIPADTSVCLGNIFVLDLTPFPGATVTGPGGFNSTDPVTLLESEGTYQISYTNDLGCMANQAMQLNASDVALSARMVLASDMVLADTLQVLEASFPTPDNVVWVFDEVRAEIVRRDANVYYFTFTETGTYDIGLIASKGGCSDAISKQVTVHADSSSIPGANLGGLEILELAIAPNPSMGAFSVMVELATTQTLILSLYRENGEQMERRRIENATDVSEVFNLDLLPGSYFLQAQAGGQRRVVPVIIQ